jgi:hypothetical protein
MWQNRSDECRILNLPRRFVAVLCLCEYYPTTRLQPICDRKGINMVLVNTVHRAQLGTGNASKELFHSLFLAVRAPTILVAYGHR